MPSKLWRKRAIENSAVHVKLNGSGGGDDPSEARIVAERSGVRAGSAQPTDDDGIAAEDEEQEEEEEPHEAVFAFDVDEVFVDSVGSEDTASNSEDLDSDCSSGTAFRIRTKRNHGPTKLKAGLIATDSTIEMVGPGAFGCDAAPGSAIDSAPGTPTSLRVSFAEPADVSQVLPIHDFIAPVDPAATPSAVRKVGLADFQVMSVIGKGAYGKVFLVRKNPNARSNSSSSLDANVTGVSVKPDLYAMKVLKKASIVLHGKDAENTKNERGILEDVRHPFIVTLHYAFQTDAKLYLLLSYASGGELFSYLAREKMFSEDVAGFYVAELLLALEHLHGLGIIYRDLKPENVLLGADGHVLLTDFGLSKVALDARTVCGTIEFMAPEVLDDRRTEGYDKAVDFWSLGVMLFDMLTGSPPFTGQNRKKIMDGIMKKKIVWPKYMTSYARDLCNKLLQKNPTKRLGTGPRGADEAKKHSFFRKMDWKKLAAKEVVPPLVPVFADPEDTSHFDECFTSMPMESPGDVLAHVGGGGNGGPGAGITGTSLAPEDPLYHFPGFSYVAESLYL
ncbi:Ribosomal protein S6 kinase beta-1 [Thoreauomyces humboldtii]|nr:Ribosomal protein S6 kinase beta-1 [Thoreauomyces humboldtii]